MHYREPKNEETLGLCSHGKNKKLKTWSSVKVYSHEIIIFRGLVERWNFILQKFFPLK